MLSNIYSAPEEKDSPLSAGCPILIVDGLRETDDVLVTVSGGTIKTLAWAAVHAPEKPSSTAAAYKD